MMMEPQAFTLIMARFDNVEAGIKKIHERMDTHVASDDKTHAVVERHATYFKLLFMGLPLIGSALAVKMGWK